MIFLKLQFKTYFVKLIQDSGKFVIALLSRETFRKLSKKPKEDGKELSPLLPTSSSTKSTNSPNLSRIEI